MSSKDDATCPVCHDVADIFAIGQCDHPICYKCSTRMRVVCDQLYCAICRTTLPKVLFVKTLNKFNNINTSAFLIERRAMIFCDTDDTSRKYKELLEHRCRVCRGNMTFQNFKQLEEHMRREHQRYSCRLCVDHIKLLSKDRKFYDRSALARHNRIGDADDTSYKGHPSCQFCDERYADNDELLKHLRKDHYYCFICESAGITNEFYCEYDNLRDHFRASHYLCEQDDCATAQFTNAFRSDIDLKAHQATAHSKNAGKHAVRQMRTIDIDFNYGPRGGARGARGGDGAREGRQRGERGYRGGGRGEERPLGDDAADSYGENSSYRNRERHNEGRERHDDRRERHDDRRERYDDRRERREKERLEVETAQLLAASLAEVQRQGHVSMIHPTLAENSRALPQQQQQQTEADLSGPVRPSLEHQTSSDFPSLGLPRPASAGSLVTTTNATTRPTTAANNAGFDSLANKVAYSAKHSVGGALAEQDFPTLPGAVGTLPGRRRSNVKASGKTVWKVDSSQMSGTILNSAPQRGQISGSMPSSASWNNLVSGTMPSSASQSSAASNQRSINSAANQNIQKSRDNDFPGLPTNRAESATKTLTTLVSKNPSKITKSEDKIKVSNVSSSMNANNGSGISSSASKASKVSELASKQSSAKNKSVAATSWSDGEDFPSLGKTSGGSTAAKQAWGPNAPETHVSDRAGFSFAGTSKRSKKDKKSAKESIVNVNSDEEVYPPKSNGLGKNATLSDVANRLTGSLGLQIAAGMEKQRALDEGKRGYSNDKVSAAAVKVDVDRKASALSQDSQNFKSNSKKNKKSEVKEHQKEQAKSEQMPKEKENVVSEKNSAQNKDRKPSDTNQQSNLKDNRSSTNNQPVKVESLDIQKEEQASASKKQNKKKGKRASEEVHENSTADKSSQGLEIKSSQTASGSVEINGVGVEKVEIMKTSSIELNSTSLQQVDSVISSSTTNTTVNFSSDDFPSLVPAKKPSIPPGFAMKAPPPGFSKSLSNVSSSTITTTKPPPGFSLPNSSDSVMLAATNIKRSYSPPKNIHERNQLLIENIRSAVGGDDEKFSIFKKCSAEFRRNEMNGEKYYTECLSLIGPALFSEIVVELLALLPDISKQQELLKVHQRVVAEKRGEGGLAWSGSITALTTCPVCCQVLVSSDVSEHLVAHDFDYDYPAMGNSTSDVSLGKSVTGRIGVL